MWRHFHLIRKLLCPFARLSPFFSCPSTRAQINAFSHSTFSLASHAHLLSIWIPVSICIFSVSSTRSLLSPSPSPFYATAIATRWPPVHSSNCCQHTITHWRHRKVAFITTGLFFSTHSPSLLSPSHNTIETAFPCRRMNTSTQLNFVSATSVTFSLSTRVNFDQIARTFRESNTFDFSSLPLFCFLSHC